MSKQTFYSLCVIGLIVIAYFVHAKLRRNAIRYDDRAPAPGDSAESCPAGIGAEKKLECFHARSRNVQVLPLPHAVESLTVHQKEELERLKREYRAGVLGFTQYKAEKFRVEGNAPYLLQPKARPMQPEEASFTSDFTSGEVGSALSPSEENIDQMTGVEFEHYCSHELRKHQWTTTVTKASGDQGLDILAERDGKKVAIQCKRYAGPIGNSAVQEIHAARSFYDADYAVVAGSSAFTVSAQALARKLDIRLLHHTDLKRLHTLL